MTDAPKKRGRGKPPHEPTALEALLDLILTNEAASAAVFADGSQRRNVKRTSMKLQWAKGKEAA